MKYPILDSRYDEEVEEDDDDDESCPKYPNYLLVPELEIQL